MEKRILIADDHQIFREGLKSLLDKNSGLMVAGEAKNGFEAVKLTQELQPDLVIMDITMPDLNGIDASRRILQEFPDCKIIALSMHSDKRFVIELLKVGVKGYVLKDSAFEELHLAIRNVFKNQTYLSPAITEIVVREFIGQKNEPVEKSVFMVLTAREREILQLLAEGKATKEIAARLSICAKTVETHRKQIMDKLQIHSVAELTKYAIREGLTSF
ncbi:MAG: DNA-binding response regulator [Candidatus Riflebacteria bacterium GWC2_50_8]|nr:MAG: DNA-binding response regulator [Candidatus Riflebacteria bacterium GWC2_50_8]